MKTLIVVALVLFSVSVWAGEFDQAYASIGDASWRTCARKALDAEVKKLRKQGVSDANIFGEDGGLGIDFAVTQVCGYAVAPAQVPAAMAAKFKDSCDDETLMRAFSNAALYPPEYFDEQIRPLCAKAPEEEDISKGWRIATVRPAAGGLMTVAVVETDRTRKVKCAAKLDGEYVAVREVTITAPVDEVTFTVKADSVSCWGQ